MAQVGGTGRRLRRHAVRSADDGHVTTIAVDPAWQRHGIGTRLLLALCREAVDRGVKALTLEVRAGNEPAQAMYRRFGFAPAGVRKNYYPRPTRTRS